MVRTTASLNQHITCDGCCKVTQLIWHSLTDTVKHFRDPEIASILVRHWLAFQAGIIEFCSSAERSDEIDSTPSHLFQLHSWRICDQNRSNPKVKSLILDPFHIVLIFLTIWSPRSCRSLKPAKAYQYVWKIKSLKLLKLVYRNCE